MNRKSKPDQKPSYRHLPLIEFETVTEQEEIRLKGLDQEKRGALPPRSLQLGEQHHAQILSSYIPEVSIRWVHASVGHGLFAEERILENHYVGEYTGIVRKNDRRYFEPLNNYCYAYPVYDDIGRNYVIDATSGCLTRFINHSRAPNLTPLYAYWEGYYHLIFLALRTIEIGEQLSYDYGENYWYVRGIPASL